MSYDPEASSPAPGGAAPLVVVPAEEEEEDDPPPPVLPRPKSPRTLQACAKVGVDVEDLVYQDLPYFEKPKFGENYVLEEVAFARFRAAESTRLLKLEQVLEARKDNLPRLDQERARFMSELQQLQARQERRNRHPHPLATQEPGSRPTPAPS